MVQKGQDISIRGAREDDREAVRAVTLAAYEEYARIMPPPLWEGYSTMILKMLAETTMAECIVAEYMGKIAGSVLLYPPSKGVYGENEVAVAAWPEVRLLAVDPAVRGHGIGGLLMRECMRLARHDGFTKLGLHTMDVMQTAMQMYERMGFVRVPELDFHPSAGIVVKGYSLDLNPMADPKL